MRILSLLPSATEIVYALGLGDHLVGASHECDYPDDARTKPVVSKSSLSTKLQNNEIHCVVEDHHDSSYSLYSVDEQLLKRIDPDLILTQELCSVCALPAEQAREAARILAGPRSVVSLEPQNLRQILENISTVAEVTNRQDTARALISTLEARIAKIKRVCSFVTERPRVFCMEWMEPPMAGGHWIPEMIRLAGGTDKLGREEKPSIAIEWEVVLEFDPQVIVLMPCGYKVARTLAEVDKLAARAGWYDLPAVKQGQVYIVDSPAYFSRPGPRVVDGLEILAQILHPELFSGLIPAASTAKLKWDQARPIELQRMSELFVPLT